ncbi:MAG: DUF2318 domain-containing protein, partial [Acidobacteria bacterium]|nr:DUF2318 domain-containing protein [Acidobacteriota bacterium]
VLMLSAVRFTSDSLLEAGGVVLGLGLAVAFGITFIRGAVRIDLRRFFRITTTILFVVVLQLLITGLHELSEGRILPSSAREMALIGPIVRNDVFFFVTVLALAAWMVLFDWRGRQPAPSGEPGSAAWRKAVWSARRERLWMAAVCTASFVFIVFITAEFVYAKAETQLTPALALTAVNGLVRIPVASVSDGQLHRFSYQSNGVTTRLIVIQRPDQTLATALDACLICGNQGYYQKGPHVLCKNCASAISIPTIGVAGGCNPIALASRVEGTDLVINATDLDGRDRPGDQRDGPGRRLQALRQMRHARYGDRSDVAHALLRAAPTLVSALGSRRVSTRQAEAAEACATLLCEIH